MGGGGGLVGWGRRWIGGWAEWGERWGAGGGLSKRKRGFGRGGGIGIPCVRSRAGVMLIFYFQKSDVASCRFFAEETIVEQRSRIHF